jgi:ribosomal protein S18 acetylase RimI-like enzyme
MAADEIKIREAHIPEDYKEIVILWQSAGPGIHLSASDSLAEMNKKQERDPDLFLIAEAGQQIIGTVLGGFDGRRGIVYHLAVTDSFRSQGIGCMLMDELENRLRKKGCIRSYLMVSLDNQDVVEFYQKLGWEKLSLHIMGKDI